VKQLVEAVLADRPVEVCHVHRPEPAAPPAIALNDDRDLIARALGAAPTPQEYPR
jgi:hypothetical protein